MPDQRGNAANIGDVIKHALLPELVLDAATLRLNGAVRYIETHAGFFDYPENLLRNQQGEWSGERAWSLGIVLDYLHRDGDLGAYGQILRKAMKSSPFVYPGSLKLVGEVLTQRTDTHLAGFDTGGDQVKSFPPSFNVSCGDGYKLTLDFIKSTEARDAIVFVDPFWCDGQANHDLREITRLADDVKSVAVWYPLTGRHAHWRSCFLENGFEAVECLYDNFDVNPWAGQDLRGAGMAFRGFSAAARARLSSQARRLSQAFAGKKFGRRLLDLK